MASRDPIDDVPERWLVDAFNVLHVGILHGRDRGRWWGAEARAQLLTRIAGFAEPGELCVVFDGPDPDAAYPGGEPEAGEGTSDGPQVVFAPSADAWLLREVKTSPQPGGLALVTADRKLADRARHHGARIVAPRDFLARCPNPDEPQP